MQNTDKVQKPDTRTWKTYRVLAGKHIDTGVDGKEFIADARNETAVFQSRCDLLKMNANGFAPKFEIIGENHPAFVQGPAAIPAQPAIKVGFDASSTLDSMSIEELKKYAEEEEIDVKNAKTKDDYLKRIKSTVKA